jgi:hypothetical protein
MPYRFFIAFCTITGIGGIQFISHSSLPEIITAISEALIAITAIYAILKHKRKH